MRHVASLYPTDGYGGLASAARACRLALSAPALAGQRLLEVAPIDSAHTSNFLLAFYSNYVPISHRFWDIARYWSKTAVWSLNYIPPRLVLFPVNVSNPNYHKPPHSKLLVENRQFESTTPLFGARVGLTPLENESVCYGIALFAFWCSAGVCQTDKETR